MKSTHSSFQVPDLDRSVYSMEGDLMLGGIFRIHKYSNDKLCSPEVQNQKLFQYAEAMVHAVHYVNSIDTILPNITLGFTILDSCTKDQVSYLIQ